ncbi:hypothetical protein Q5P01_020339 [Channa striata]|uniref:C-type lectin domain-containing protein n=1 Tax=Channa striata TaxID=64152 RepID=A0AA88LZP3_CHASR|nr:hypothetical protein Q5P01_020339 [Channa striata]
MSSEQKINEAIGRDGHSEPRDRTFGQGLFRKRGGSAFLSVRLVIVCLALLNAVLLIAAFIIGIYCAKATDLESLHSADAALMVELNYLHNHSEVTQAKLEAQRTLAAERKSHRQLMLQVKQMKTITDGLQGKIETLKTEKTYLQTNITSIEESCGRCLPGWVLLNSSCYYFSRNDINYKKNWLESRAYCTSQGGDLLVINNSEEQELMSYHLPKSSNSGAYYQNGFWIGLSLKLTTWVWVNNVTETESLYWKYGHPNRSDHQRYNCAAFHNYNDARRTWFNANCTEVRMKWICEMQPK